MAKFNRQTIETALRSRPDATVNFEGAIAFTQTPELQLYRMACTSMFGEDKFYQRAAENDKDFIHTLRAVEDSKYLLQLANYVRNKMYLRSVPVVLLAEAGARKELKLAPSAKNGKSVVRQYCPLILKRVDDCTEFLAYWLSRNGKPIPNAIKRGVADTLKGFDDYQLAKYRAKGKEVTLSDVVRLCARSLIKEGNRFHKLVEGTLRSEGTWEVEVSAKGNTQETWEGILPRMGIMAVLRNLRNMINADVDVELIQAKFTDDAILKSKQLPFRWFSAYKVLSNEFAGNLFGTNELIDLLERAITISCRNIEKLSGSTAIFVDHSGSMDSNLSERGTVTYFETGAVLGAIAKHICDKSIVGLFGEDFKFIALGSDILQNVSLMQNTDVGHSTNAWLAVESLLQSKETVDRIIILTDMQVYNTHDRSSYERSLAGRIITYRKQINPNVKTYILDMAGYQNACVPEDENGVTQLAGWSDKIFDFIHANEIEPGKVIDLIKSNY